MLGLQRAFQVAGARSVVASQWRVPDEATRALMREFYKRLWGKDLVSKAEALRQAQVLMIEKWDAPSGDFRGTTEPKDDGGPLPPLLLGRLHPQRRLEMTYGTTTRRCEITHDPRNRKALSHCSIQD